MTHFDMVRKFMEKFNLAYKGLPRQLDSADSNFRIGCMQEELNEYVDAVAAKDANAQLDALVDLAYFVYGTAYMHGFDFDTAFEMVHESNMRKNQDPKKQRRGYELEVTKPDDWVAPDLTKLTNPQISRFFYPEDSRTLCGLISLDGPDHAGKTTLGKRIAYLTNGEYIGLTWSPIIEKHMNAYRLSYITLANIMSRDRVVVIDRAWLSHPIYGDIFRNQSQDYEKWKKHIDAAACLHILAIPGKVHDWLDDFEHSGHQQLYPNRIKMVRVRQAFVRAFNHNAYGFGIQKYGDKTNVLRTTMYDYQHFNTPAAVDNFISAMVLPALTEIGDK